MNGISARAQNRVVRINGVYAFSKEEQKSKAGTDMLRYGQM